MIKNKKQMFTIISVFTLVMVLGTITYAFFNYTRTGSSNTIKVGRISFVSKNEQTINLTNLFPIDPTETGIMNDSTKVGTYTVEIKGDTDYVDGIEYLISTVDTNIYTNQGQIVPISLDVTVEDLGTASPNYFTARESKNATIYKKLVGDTLVGDQMLLVGYIKPNTTSGTAEGVDGSITIKAYLDKNKILISDTYDGTESDNMGTTNNQANGKTVITTTEWNALQNTGVSFKVKVEANEGIWVTGSLEEIMKVQNLNTTTNQPIRDDQQSTYVTGANGIDFSKISGDTDNDGIIDNGKGVYMRAGTENDAYPILYYRGEVEDNNVVLNNKCWKAVRTTDTGGVKLLYNGLAKNIMQGVAQSDYNITINTNNMFSYDNATTKWTGISTSSETVEFEFTVPTGDNYVFDVEVKTSNSCGGTLTISKNDSAIYTTSNGGGAIIPYTYNAGTLTASDKIKFTFAGSGATASYPLTYIFQMYQSNGNVLGKSCDNSEAYSQITLTENNTAVNTFKFNENVNSPAYVGYMYGTVYEYSTANWTSGARFGSSFTWDGTNYTLVDDETTTPNPTHHYSCNVISKNGTCTQLRYVYYLSGSTYYYITLTGGDGVEEALVKMNTNTNDSNAKDKIETWYANNMTSYANRIEDTAYCDDRSISQLGGWDPNGGSLTASLTYGSPQRIYVNHSPSTVCPRKHDSFTWKNSSGNQKLQYPVGLLTVDEIVMAGGMSNYNTSYYLATGKYYWSLSPSYFQNYAYVSYVVVDGYLNYVNVANSYGLRPVVSLKPGTPVISGSGTVADPYVIE